MSRKTAAILIEVTGATLILLQPIMFMLNPHSNVAVAVALVLVGGALWITAGFVAEKREAWMRSAQITFVVFSLGQASAVAVSQRAERAAEKRNARADSLAELRLFRADSGAVARAALVEVSEQQRQARRDSAEDARFARKEDAELSREYYVRSPDFMRVGPGYTLTMGENRFLGTPGAIVVRIGGAFDIGYDREGNPALVGDVRDENGAVAGSFRQSRFVPTAGSSYDINYDSWAYELVDSRHMPILQMIREEDSEGRRFKVKVYAYGKHGRSPGARLGMFICDGAMVWLSASEGRRRQGEAEVMFRYPGFKFPGVRRNW